MSLLSRLLLTIATLTSCVTISFAQGQAPIGKDLTVTVKVTDKTGAMPGASVLVKGTTNGQITGPDGTATLSNVPADATLVVSFVGYQDVELHVNGKTSLNALLKDDSLALNEIVVVVTAHRKRPTSREPWIRSDPRHSMAGPMPTSPKCFRDKYLTSTSSSPTEDLTVHHPTTSEVPHPSARAEALSYLSTAWRATRAFSTLTTSSRSLS